METGLRVLAALAASGGPATLTSLGQRSGLSPSQTHRYLQSLVAAGMAVQDPSLRYDLGPGVIRIGIAALSRLDTFARAEAAMLRFTEDTGRSSLLSVWGEAGPVCVRWMLGRPPVTTNHGVGSVLPLLFSAAGHVFLTFLTEQELAGPLAAAMADRVDRPDIAAIRRTVRRNLIAAVGPVLQPGLRSMAAPIFDLQGRAALVASTVAIETLHPADTDAAVSARLLQACREATEEAGGAWPEQDFRS